MAAVSKTTSMLHHVGTLLLFLSFLMLLVVSISSPVVNDISLLKVTLSNATSRRHSSVTYGTFGHCVLDIYTADGSDQDQCSRSTIGYPIAQIQGTIDNGKTSFGRGSEDTLQGLTNVMILHPVACVLAFIAFAFTLGASHFGTLLGSFVAFLAWLCVLVSMVIDWIVFGTVKDHVNDNTKSSGSHAKFGPAIWLMLATFILLFFSSIITFLSCFQRRKARRNDLATKNEMVTDEYGNTAVTTAPRRKRFGLF